MTWLFFFKRSKCFPYCGTLNGCRKCCHSTLLSKLPEWGFGSGRCQCGRFQRGTDPAQVSSRWERDLRSLRPLLILQPQMNTVFSSCCPFNSFQILWKCVCLTWGQSCYFLLYTVCYSTDSKASFNYCSPGPFFPIAKQIFCQLSTNVHVLAESRWTEGTEGTEGKHSSKTQYWHGKKQVKQKTADMNITRWRRKRNRADTVCFRQPGSIILLSGGLHSTGMGLSGVMALEIVYKAFKSDRNQCKEWAFGYTLMNLTTL